MERLSTQLERTARTVMAAGGPEAVALWEMARLPPTTDIQDRRATLAQRIQRGQVAMQALEELRGTTPANVDIAQAAQRAALTHTEAEIVELDALLARCQERDRVAATRPAGCICLGLGGAGYVYPVDGVPVWSEWCGCPEGRAARAPAKAALAAAEERAQAQRAAEVVAAAEATAAARVERAHIPAHFRALSFATFPADVAKQEAVWALQRFGQRGGSPRGIFLTGSFGVGKTGLAICALKAWLETERGSWTGCARRTIGAPARWRPATT
jgi:hypothetical protein